MFKLLLSIPSIVYTLMGWLNQPVFPVQIEKDVVEYRLYSDSLGAASLQVLDYKDSMLVVETVCAPICSSTARVFDRDGKLIRTIAPDCEGTLPFAWIENGKVHWRDNTEQMLDEQELKVK